MDREEALKLLMAGSEGVEEWNRRRLGCEEVPGLEDADFNDVDISGANLIVVKLNGADLRKAGLASAILRRASLVNAHLSKASLGHADLVQANLMGADLRQANLESAVLEGAMLRSTDLSGANLRFSNFTRVDLRNANLAGARCFRTTFGDTDLGDVRGLESVVHDGPSTIGTDTLLFSRGKIPEAFLRGCGLPDAWIANLPALIGAFEPIQFFSCFISYSTADEEFANRVHNDFQAAGIRCWKWDHDARTGKSLWGEIDQAIRVHDKLVLIASESSLTSPPVNREIERAIRQEDERTVLKQQDKFDGDIDVLFPVRLDDFIFKGWEHERKVDVTKKMIADASGWHTDPAIYARVRDRLIRDLKAQK